MKMIEVIKMCKIVFEINEFIVKKQIIENK